MSEQIDSLDKMLDKIFNHAVDKAYEIMDAKSFADPYKDGKSQIKAYIAEREQEAYKRGYIDRGIEELTK